MSQYNVPIPKGYNPPNDQCARLAAWLMLRTSSTKEYRAGHYIPMPKSTWVSMFGSHQAPQVKRQAIESGLINCNQRYKPGAWPQSVRLEREYRTGSFEQFTLRRKPRTKPWSESNLMRLGSVGMQLRAKMEDFYLDRSVEPLSPWEVFQIDRLRHRDYYATRCDFGRFHSNFTSLSSRIRRSLRCSTGDDLVAIDVKNIQPLILGIQAARNTRNSAPSTITTHHNQAHSTSAIPICGALFVCHWQTLCEQGMIYEWCLDRLRAGEVEPYEVRCGTHRFIEDPRTWDRKRVKKSFLVCLFAKNDDTVANPLFKLFRRYFPEIAEFILEAKRREHQALAQACQRFESTVMIDGVASEFMRRYPWEPILTIHDELIARESSVRAVRALVADAFREYGIEPRLSIATLQPTKCGLSA